jgi:hypothetical protein
MTTASLVLASTSLALGLLDAWLAGRLVRLARVGGEIAEAGVAMGLTLIFATFGVAWTLVAALTAIFGSPGWIGLWVPTLIVCFEVVGVLLSIHYVGTGSVAYRKSFGGGGGDFSNADPGALIVLALLLLPLIVGVLPVWLVFRASARRDGNDLALWPISKSASRRFPGHSGSAHNRSE